MLPQPKICPDSIYDVMLQCWKYKPQDRITFTEVLKALESECFLLEESPKNGSPSTEYDTTSYRSSSQPLRLV